jgi:hypothetical protein
VAKKQVVWGKVTIELKGRTIEGHYGDDGRVVIVRYGGDSKATQLGGSPSVTIAKTLLRELAVRAETDQQ